MSVSDVRSELAEHTALSERVAVEMADQIDRLAELVTETLRRGGKLLLCGNGGSAADAQHLAAEYVVLGGGNAADVGKLTEVCRLGANEDAFLGGFRLWVDA